MSHILRALTALAASAMITAPLVPGTAQATEPLLRVAPTQTLSLLGDLTPSIYETAIQRSINRIRTNRGLPRVRLRSCPDHVAESWVKKLLRLNLFEHQSMSAFSYKCNYSYVGEIIAMAPATPQMMVRMWMASPGHRAVILDRRFRFIGVGANRDLSGNWRGVADFGRW